MRLLIILLLGLFTFQTQAQEVKRVVKGGGFSNEREEYYVLKSNKEIKHGKYMKFTNTYGTTIETGYYKNNLKDSVWTEFFPGTKEFISKGYYKNGKKEGLWQYRKNLNHKLYLSEQGLYKNDKKIATWQTFNFSGEVIKAYDHSLEKLFYEKPKPDTLNFKVLTEEGWVNKKLEKAPILKNGLTKELYNTIILDEARFLKPRTSYGSGVTVIEFIVDEEGKESEHKIIVPFVPSFDKELLRAKKTIQRPWEPGILDGKPVKTKVVFPVYFKGE